jgi:hypothetical protein
MYRTGSTLVVLAILIACTGVAASGQNVSDSTAPQVSDISFSPASVDTTSGDQSVTVSVNATDDLSGVNYAHVYLETTNTSQTYNYWRSTSRQRAGSEKENQLQVVEGEAWCERGESNPHGFPRQILSLVRLPISPLSHF